MSPGLVKILALMVSTGIRRFPCTTISVMTFSCPQSGQATRRRLNKSLRMGWPEPWFFRFKIVREEDESEPAPATVRPLFATAGLSCCMRRIATTSNSGIMENGHYTVEPCEASKPKHCPFYTLCCFRSISGSRLRRLHFNQDGIKRGGVAHVGEFF